MLKFILIFLSITLYSNIYSQSRYGYLLPDTSILTTTSMSNKMYAGIDNRLKLNTTEVHKYDSVMLKCNNGKLLFDNNYFTIPLKPGNLRIEMHGLIDNQFDTIGYLNFKVLRLPNPKISFGNFVIDDQMKIKQEMFLRADSLHIVVTDDIPESKDWVEIKEFTIGYSYGGYFVGASSSSNLITSKMKYLVRTQGYGRWFSLKVITQSATSMSLTNPIYKVFFY